MKVYKIQNLNDKKLFWSNTFGYCDRRSSDTFTKEDTKISMLPIEGKWYQVELKVA